MTIANIEEKLGHFTLIKQFGEKEMKENPYFKSLNNDFDIIQATNYFLDKKEATKVLCSLTSISLAKAYCFFWLSPCRLLVLEKSVTK